MLDDDRTGVPYEISPVGGELSDIAGRVRPIPKPLNSALIVVIRIGRAFKSERAEVSAFFIVPKADRCFPIQMLLQNFHNHSLL